LIPLENSRDPVSICRPPCPHLYFFREEEEEEEEEEAVFIRDRHK
jgi:hypothetical protein